MKGLVTLPSIDYLVQASGKSFNQLFDVAAGSSNGAIFAAMLSNGKYKGRLITPKILMGIYLQKASHILNPKPPTSTKIKDPNQAEQYAAEQWQELLSQLLSQSTLAGSSTKLVIPSYALSKQRPCIFDSWSAQSGKNYFLKDIIAASTSTPGVFPPFDLKTTKGKSQGYFLDPGPTFTNQPVLNAYAAARAHCPKCQFIIASFGTGWFKPLTQHQIHSSLNWTPSKWKKELSFYIGGNIPRYATEKNQLDILRILADLPESHILYYHNFDIKEKTKSTALDFNTNATLLKSYLNLGTKMMKKNKKELDKLMSLLLRYQN